MKSIFFNDPEMAGNLNSYLSDGDVAPSALHAAAYRLTQSVSPEAVAIRLKQNLAILPVMQKAAEGRDYVWLETLRYRADSLQAADRVRKEMERPLAETFPYIRVVLLAYTDRFVDLVIVANRAVFDKSAMDALVCAAISEQEADYQAPAASSGPEPELSSLLSADFSPLPDWRGKGDECEKGVIRRRLGVFSDQDDQQLVTGWVSALATVWARYSATNVPVVAINDSRAESVSGWSLVAAPVQEDATAQTLKLSIEHSLRQPIWRSQELANRLQDCENGGEVSLAALIYDAAASPHDKVAACDYAPSLGTPYPLTLLIESQGQGRYCISGLADGGVFAADSVEQFFQCVRRAYELLRADGELNLCSFPLLDAKAQQEVAALGVDRELGDIPTERLEELFARQVARTPDAIALSYENEQMTYAQLERKAHLMALNLVVLNVKPGDRVGICLERSFDLIASMLAILKAGAIYIPMDPAYPEERLSYTCDNAEIRLVITDADAFPAAEERRLITPSELERSIDDARVATPSAEQLSAEEDAYVIYTSGSTGKPKGVVVPHKNVVSLLAATQEDFGLNAQDAWTFFHSAAFDFSVWEIWGSLLTGAHLVIVPYWVSRAPDEFLELVREKQVSVLNQTPSAFSQFMEMERNGAPLAHLRLVIFGGEPLDAKMLMKWFDRYPESRCRLVNMFGITETTVHVTAQTITRAEAMVGSRSVGPAIPGWRLYVLDAARNILPVGVAGEIYVAGAGVASQYLNRPDLTEERFMPDPFCGGRMYRSGDKGRLLPCGRLEHLGRLDSQVKLRGFRIELDEIRKVLLGVHGVEAAAVVLNQPDKNDPASARLDSYLVLSDIAVEDVIVKAEKVLPAYMMPSTFTPVDAMPLTANGKLDVKKLPAPNGQGKVADKPRVVVAERSPEPVESSVEEMAAETEADRLVADMVRVWSEVLGREVTAADNFFSLGGNSLYAVRIASAMRAAGLPALPIRELYVRQTIEKLAPVMVGKGG
ncbi:Non-ribosomal peptide synthetase modules and related protein [Hahella chejuensis KCTC 2396]|uniref:Non-ribosomal peptide synthetase modules and related protein n=1 Tax=Hahella chejuensis (strain KCTC 2396) TaxID=349521 RepID=Q2SKG1_HAHCH|nr:amino acid adenylation domain-containing protein [Hahella chejuensis]ABC28863.1 Non-ribosomal peptide synthetase modules and related protein [Hahella chejuensis KCTC 2396]